MANIYNMAKKESSIKRNCFDNALKLLFKFESPTDNQIYRHLCAQGNCPTGQCTYLFGFKEGKNCDHVNTVKRIISKLLVFRNGD